MRVEETTGGSTSELVHDRYSADGVADLIEADASAYVHGPGGVLEHDEGGSVSFPLVDALGSVRAVTDASGAVAGRSSYEVFGAVSSSSGTDVGLGFGGAPQDGDLVHLSARDLHTGLGRFLSTDPVRPGAPGTVGWNPYTYVANNPTTWTDPSGMVAAGEYGSLVSRVSARTAVASRLAGQCIAGAIQDAAFSAGIAVVAGGMTAGSLAADAVLGCVGAGRAPTPGPRVVNGRFPINSSYAGRLYDGPGWTDDLAVKYPSGVRFSNDGFPDFSQYARARVQSDNLTGIYRTDAAAANSAAGLARTPNGYVWHHVEDGRTLILIPRDLHNAIRHTGGAAVIRGGG